MAWVIARAMAAASTLVVKAARAVAGVREEAGNGSDASGLLRVHSAG